MTRKHRSIHRIIWPLLALMIGLGLGMALYLRPPPDGTTAQSESKR